MVQVLPVPALASIRRLPHRGKLAATSGWGSGSAGVVVAMAVWGMVAGTAVAGRQADAEGWACTWVCTQSSRGRNTASVRARKRSSASRLSKSG